MKWVPVHSEGPRYATSLVLLPGMWAGPGVLRPLASFLGHRGWQGLIADFAAGPTDPEARVSAVLDLVASREAPPVLIACDGSGPIALQVARRGRVAAVVWLAPLRPGGRPLRGAVSPWAVLRALLTGATVARPTGALARALLGTATPECQAREAGPVVVGMVRGRSALVSAGVPTLLLSGEHDALLPPLDAKRLADEVGAEVAVLADAPHWLLGSGHWLACASQVHRWLVHRLGESLLEIYAETMAERDENE
jgi:pimeloyl-ACP methyl ester carboxylesterase